VEECKVDLIKAGRHAQIPSHYFYADDLMVYCKGKFLNLEALKEIFTKYAACSRQVMNLRKSFIYSGGVTPVRLQNIVNLLGFSVGTLPFTYLGATIFKGRPKLIHFQSIVDRVRIKLATWKASLLSIARRVQLVKFVIQSMLIYKLSIYSWPIKLLGEMEI